MTWNAMGPCDCCGAPTEGDLCHDCDAAVRSRVGSPGPLTLPQLVAGAGGALALWLTMFVLFTLI